MKYYSFERPSSTPSNTDLEPESQIEEEKIDEESNINKELFTPDFESQEFKNAVRGLENCNGLSSQSKFTILSTALRIKPATSFNRSAGSTRPEVNQVLTKLSIYFDCPAGEILYTIGNTRENLLKAMAASPVTDDDEYGRAMGFPESAVEAFRDKDLLMTNPELRDLLTEEERQFIFFALSKKHYKEELQWLHRMIDGVKKHSPQLYEQMMEAEIDRD